MTSTSTPIFTVIVPAYNVARYLARSLGSVTAQTNREFEIIVVDDGSKDDPSTVIRNVAPSARCITFEGNRGLSAARNAGIAAARGRYIALLDADDYWEPDKLERQLQLFRKDDGIDVAFCDFAHEMPDGSPTRWQGGLLARNEGWSLKLQQVAPDCYAITGPVAFELIKRTSFMHPSTVVVRRTAFERAGLFDESFRAVEDLEMWIRLAMKCRIGFVNRVLVHVEQRADSLKHDSTKMSEYMIKVYNSLPKHVPSMPEDVKAAVQQHLSTLHGDLGWTHLNRGDVQTSRLHYRASWNHRPSSSTLLDIAKTYIPSGAFRVLRRVKSTLLGGRD